MSPVPAVPVTPDGPRRRSVLRNASVLSVATVAARLSMFAVGIVLARSVGGDAFGRYSLALAIGAVLQPVADFGLSTYVVRETARDRKATEAVLRRLAEVKIFGLVATAAVALAGAAVFDTETGLLLVVAAMVTAAMLDGWTLFVFCYLQGREEMGYEARATATAALARALGAIVLAIVTGRLGPVVAWILAVAVLQAAASSMKLRRTVGALPRTSAIEVDWRSVASMGLVGIFVVVYLRADVILIGWYTGEGAVGLYAAAYTVMLGAQIVPTMIAAALLPIFARTFGTDRRGFGRAWDDGVLALGLITLPIAVAVGVLSEPIVARTFGPEFGASGEVLRVLILGVPLVGVALVAQAVLRGGRHETSLVWVTGACAVANVGANLIVIPRWGIDGAAVTTVGTELLGAGLLLQRVLALGLVEPPDVPWLRVAVAVGALGVVAAGLRDAPVELALVAASTTYVGVLVATGVLRGAGLARLRGLARSDDADGPLPVAGAHARTGAGEGP